MKGEKKELTAEEQEEWIKLLLVLIWFAVKPIK
jgi:hypothetical protein